MNEIDTLNNLLNADLSQTPTSFPVLSRGLYRFRFEEPKVVDTKAHDGNKNMVIKFVLVSPNPAKSTDGRDVNAGFSILHNIYLPAKVTDDKSKKALEIAQRNLATLKEALTGSHTGSFGDPSQYIGVEFDASLDVENDPQYGERNKIARFIPKSV